VIPDYTMIALVAFAPLLLLWTPEVRESWALYVPSLLWVVWGIGLGVATFSYYLRRRGPGRHCGQDDDLRGDSAPRVVVTMDR
jgi:fatty acid desaturase